MSEPIPNPGSSEAIKAGCTCAVMDNHRGRGFHRDEDGRPLFYISGGCPLHWPDETKSITWQPPLPNPVPNESL